MVQPGDTLDVIVKLIEAVPIEIGTSFEVFEPGAREWQDGRWVQTSDDKLVIRGEVLEVLK